MSEKQQKYFPVSWAELHRDARALAWRLSEMGPWKGIIAVTRGGLVPAAIIARELEIRLIDTACISSYDHQNLRETVILKPVSVPAEEGGKGYLVIDDLVDTGRTLETLRQMLPHAHIATIYAKPKGRHLVDTFVTEVSQDTWIFFPWDAEMTYSQPIAEKKNTQI